MADRSRAPRVAVGCVHPDELKTSFSLSLDALRAYDAATSRFLVHDHSRLWARCGTDGLVASRNTVARALLDSGVDWMLWVDSDMGFEPDALQRLMEVADPVARPVVGGLCFASRQVAHDGMNGFRTVPQPTIYDWVEVDGRDQFVTVPTYPVSTVMRCAGTGSAFVLIHRSVFEKVSTMLAERGLDPEGWYNRTHGSDGSLLGEDISFCVRAAAAGIPIYVHTGVRTTHLKPQWVGEADYWRVFDAPPATDDTAVIVPVLGRPEHAAPFMASLRASTALATAYAVLGPEDTAEHHQAVEAAWRRAGAVVLHSESGRPAALTFAEKVNAGYRQTSEPWLFLVGSDVRFRAGWLDHAQHVARMFGAQVVGTNDLGNPEVLAGRHATHMLIARAYVDEHGASWDGPGVVCHEGYRHQYVDNEIVMAAQQRGVWAMALGSHVEHLHPYCGKAPMDDVYRLGEKHAKADYARFQQRVATHAQDLVRSA